MAHLLPSDISKLELSEARSPEHATLAILEAGLTQEFTVFHSVHWSNVYERRTVFGEIDFVVVNQAGDVLVVEQKNGRLEETQDGLVKQYTGESKSVVGQLNRSLNQIRKKYQYIHGKEEEPGYSYLFYCPDYRVQNLNAAGLDKSCIVDSHNVENLCAVINQLLGPGQPNVAKHKRVFDFFAQSYHLVLDVHARKASLNKRYKELASSLIAILNNLEIDPFLLRVSGTAGSGKSLLAAEFYQRQLDQDKKVLFLCFNRPLADQLVQNLPDGGIVDTWLGFVQRVLRDRGLGITPDGTNQFWDNRLGELIDLGIDDTWQFDALVVDEGQDFEELWWMVLKENFLRPDAHILWLEDPDQNVRGVEWQQREFPTTFHARTNFRSPNRIGQFILEKLPFDFEVGNGIRGLGVGEHWPETDEDLKYIVDRLIKKWIAEGFGTDEIIVLTCQGLKRSFLYGIEKLGGRPIEYFTGEYSVDGAQVYTEGDVRFDSVRRFKGQQAPVVILVDVNLAEDKKLLERQRVVFTGMTRATLRLEVVHALELASSTI
jgi:hypothetical protein